MRRWPTGTWLVVVAAVSGPAGRGDRRGCGGAMSRSAGRPSPFEMGHYRPNWPQNSYRSRSRSSTKRLPNFFGGIPDVPLKKIAMLCVSLKKFSGLQRHCSNFFVPSMPLSSVWALTPSTAGVKSQKYR